MRSEKVEVQVSVLGGFPCIAVATIYPPEPDVGIFGSQVEVQELRTLKGKPADFIERRMKPEDWDEVAVQVLEDG